VAEQPKIRSGKGAKNLTTLGRGQARTPRGSKSPHDWRERKEKPVKDSIRRGGPMEEPGSVQRREVFMPSKGETICISKKGRRGDEPNLRGGIRGRYGVLMERSHA